MEDSQSNNGGSGNAALNKGRYVPPHLRAGDDRRGGGRGGFHRGGGNSGGSNRGYSDNRGSGGYGRDRGFEDRGESNRGDSYRGDSNRGDSYRGGYNRQDRGDGGSNFNRGFMKHDAGYGKIGSGRSHNSDRRVNGGNPQNTRWNNLDVPTKSERGTSQWENRGTTDKRLKQDFLANRSEIDFDVLKITHSSKLYNYNECMFESLEELIETMMKDGIVKEEQWKKQTHKYTPTEFLKMAKQYMEQSPPDLIQASEKMWLSVVYSIKHHFLKMKFHLASHRSLSLFYDLLMNSLEHMPNAHVIKIEKAFRFAEKLHSFCYGLRLFKPQDFHWLYKEIEFFVQEFNKIEKLDVVEAKVREIIREVDMKERNDINCRKCNSEIDAKPFIGDDEFDPEYKFF